MLTYRNSYCYPTLLHVDESLQMYSLSKDVMVGDKQKGYNIKGQFQRTGMEISVYAVYSNLGGLCVGTCLLLLFKRRQVVSRSMSQQMEKGCEDTLCHPLSGTWRYPTFRTW